ncbi:MAG: hypothetical protein AB7V46_24960, partial [Thermomicrobiales bacterium]
MTNERFLDRLGMTVRRGVSREGCPAVTNERFLDRLGMTVRRGVCPSGKPGRDEREIPGKRVCPDIYQQVRMSSHSDATHAWRTMLQGILLCSPLFLRM